MILLLDSSGLSWLTSDNWLSGLPIARWAGVMGDGSLWSSLTAVSGLELMTPSIFTSNVSSSVKVRSAFPRTLCNGSLTALQNRSHQPPLHGDHSVMNFHLIPFDANSDSMRFWSSVSHMDWLCVSRLEYNLWISLLAALNVFALSDHTVWHRPLWLVMRLKTCRNVSVVRLFVSSRWTIWDEAQVNTHIPFLHTCSLFHV